MRPSLVVHRTETVRGKAGFEGEGCLFDWLALGGEVLYIRNSAYMVSLA